MTKASYHRPWDPLGLSSSLDSGLRVKKLAVAFPLYRVHRGRFLWSPLTDANCYFAYGGEEELLATLTAMAVEAGRGPQKHSSHLHFYAVREAFPRVEEVAEAHETFTYHRYEDGFASLLLQLEEQVKTVLREAKGRGWSEPANKVVEVVFLPLQAQDRKLLALSRPLLQAFSYVLAHGHEARIYPFVAVEDAALLPLKLQHLFTASLYCGPSNRSFFEEHHQALPYHGESFVQEAVGVGYRPREGKAYELYSLRFKESARYKELQETRRKEAEAYRWWLSQLRKEDL